jgi:cytochrome c oxidase assembly factor CtaG
MNPTARCFGRAASRPASAGIVALGLVLPRPAWAHPGRALQPHDVWTAWTLAPAVIGGLALACWLYARGLRALHARAGRRVVAPWRARAFAAGIATLVVALISPLDALGSALFSAHMMQHLLLVMVAPPLLLLGDPLIVSLWALPLARRRAIAAWWRRARAVRAAAHAVTRPAVAWPLHVTALWVWHLPALYERALRNEGTHVLEHASFFLTALLFWWALVRPHGRRLGAGLAVLYLFGAALQSTILGALLTLARRPLYPGHFETTRPFGLTPLEDQQLAGLLMWIPAGAIYLVPLVPFVVRTLRESRGQRVELTVAGMSARGTP